MANHPIAHLEIPAENPAAAGKFYSDVFGWILQPTQSTITSSSSPRAVRAGASRTPRTLPLAISQTDYSFISPPMTSTPPWPSSKPTAERPSSPKQSSPTLANGLSSPTPTGITLAFPNQPAATSFFGGQIKHRITLGVKRWSLLHSWSLEPALGSIATRKCQRLYRLTWREP